MPLLDIFNAKKSVISDSLKGKVLLIYGKNNVGKTYQATRFEKPLVIACEIGLNGIDGIPYLPVTRWSEFRTIVKQLTNEVSMKKALEMYSTIIIDEVYAASIYCQDYICQTHGDGALALADGDSKHNLYQLYEKEFFRQINALTNTGYTIIFIAHEQINTKTDFITPKGDKRCIDPIVDRCDYVVYLKSNGVDSEGRVIKSSAGLAETSNYFARSRIEYTPTFLPEFTMESLTEAIKVGIQKKKEIDGATIVSFDEQQKMNKKDKLDFKAIVKEFNDIVASIPGSADSPGSTPESLSFMKEWLPDITRIIENYLGKGGKIANCNENQTEAIYLIVDDLKDLVNNKKKVEEEPNKDDKDDKEENQ